MQARQARYRKVSNAKCLNLKDKVLNHIFSVATMRYQQQHPLAVIVRVRYEVSAAETFGRRHPRYTAKN